MSPVFSKIAMLCTLANPVAFEGSEFDVATREFYELLKDNESLEAFLYGNIGAYRSYKTKATRNNDFIGARWWWENYASSDTKKDVMWNYIKKTQWELDDMLADRIVNSIYKDIDLEMSLDENRDGVHENMNNISRTFYTEFYQTMYSLDQQITRANSHVFYQIAMEIMNLHCAVDTFHLINVSNPMDQWPHEQEIHELMMGRIDATFQNVGMMWSDVCERFYSRLKDLQYNIDV